MDIKVDQYVVVKSLNGNLSRCFMEDGKPNIEVGQQYRVIDTDEYDDSVLLHLEEGEIGSWWVNISDIEVSV